MTKESLENKLYDEELNLEELLELKKNMEKYDFDDRDFEYVNELIAEEIDMIDDVNELEILRKKYQLCGYDIELFDYAINLRNVLHNKEIEDMDNDELMYIYENKDLNIVNLFRLYTCMKKHNMDKFYIDDVEGQIKEEIEYIDDEADNYEDELKELNRIYKECIKYNCDAFILQDAKTKLINEIRELEKEEHPVGIGKYILGGLFGVASGFTKGLLDNHPNSNDHLMSWERDLVNKGDYTEDQFEEEDMDEDDYYKEDW